MTEVNLYLEDKDRKLRTYNFSESVTNIDMARMLLLKYVNPFYLSVKYKVFVSNKFVDGEYLCEVDVIFENNTELNREFLLKELLV